MPEIPAAENEITDEVTSRHVVNAADAREQASEGRYSFLRSEFRRAKPTAKHPDGEVFEIPHRDLFDNDQQQRWEDLQDAMRHYQREPDIYTPDGGTLIAKGALIQPHHDKDGNRLPPWPYRLAVVVWGEEGAKRANAGGINFNEIEVVWQKQAYEMEQRIQRDPKSTAGGAGVAPATDSDRG